MEYSSWLPACPSTWYRSALALPWNLLLRYRRQRPDRWPEASWAAPPSGSTRPKSPNPRPSLAGHLHLYRPCKLAFQQHRNLKLGVQLFAISATTIGFSAFAVAFDKGAGEHLPYRSQTADEPAAQIEVVVAWHIYQ